MNRSCSRWLVAGLALFQSVVAQADDRSPLRISVYVTAGDVLQHLAPPQARPAVVDRLAALQVSRVFLEGRRGDEYVSPAVLAEVRDYLATRGIATAGGIATVPGANFGTRQQGPLGWLNWESPGPAPMSPGSSARTPRCSGNSSSTTSIAPATPRRNPTAPAAPARGGYRRDLLVSLIPPLIVEPTHAARPDTRLILKFPQWYDRFHLFGYDPVRMAEPFDAIWVGTEVRNPLTRRMGFVQPTEGYVNFSWIRSAVGPRVVGAWFDHIECTPQNFVDQAYLAVLAGAEELTLFRLGDVMDNHPGDALLAQRLPQLRELSLRVRASAESRRGVPYYKPPGSDAADNLYLMDSLAMLGWPILPAAQFPTNAPVLCLGAQSAADPAIHELVETVLGRGATVVVTPGFLRQAGPATARWTRFTVGAAAVPTELTSVKLGSMVFSHPAGLSADRSLGTRGSCVRRATGLASEPGEVLLLATHRQRRGTVVVLNVRTFSDADFRDSGEWLLAPRALGWSTLPAPIADRLRQAVLRPLNTAFEAPAGVALHLFDGAACLYSFLPEPADVRFGDQRLTLAPHDCRWIRYPSRDQR